AHQGKLYLIGGIQQQGITRKVSVFDPASQQWSEGPELKPDSGAAGFATSSFAVGGRLYVTGNSGVVYRLTDDGKSWEIADRLLYPRMFLRLLPVQGDRLIALGGTGNLGRLAVVESLRVNPDVPPSPKLIRWSVPFDGRAKHSQSLVLRGSKLYAFGGNASRSPHDFSKDAFVKQAFVFDIARQTVEKLPDMPTAVQGGAGVVASQTSEHKKIVVAGGLAFGERKYGSTDQILEFDPEAKSWTTANVSLPVPRAMFDAEVHDDAIWMFGGSDAGDGKGLDSDVLHWWGDETKVGTLPNVAVPTLRRSFGGAIVGDEYYMIGGIGDGTNVAETVDVFHLTDRTWRQAAAPKIARVFPSVCAVGKKIYVFGGFAMSSGHFGEVNSLDVYDTQSDTWSTVAEDLPAMDASMRIINMNGRLLFYAVDRQRDGVANFVLYDPTPTADPGVVESMAFGRRRGNEAEKNAKMLMRKDTDKDGKLNADELGERMAEFAKRADTNGDGLVSFPEAKAAMETE
ncbi:MAG: hypothetical protein MI861_15070, partial [Pirellulales bacterium]|nr:hypothetical protein [Pirellulales bacterium]